MAVTNSAPRTRLRRALGLVISLCPLAVLALFLFPIAPAQAADWTVGTGSAESCNMITLAQPINNFTDANITFNCGGPAVITITQAHGLNIFGGHHYGINGGDLITITGDDSVRLFNLGPGSALTLTHIVLTAGNDPNGGAVINGLGYLALDHVTLVANHSQGPGGAIEDLGGVTRVSNSLIISNTASVGGAIYSQGQLTVSNTLLRANLAYTGGALYLDGAGFINASQFISNTGFWHGGGLKIGSAGVVSVAGSQFTQNQVYTASLSQEPAGGAIANAGVLTLTQSNLTGNSADEGGGLYNAHLAQALVQTSTFSANQARLGGGAANDYTATLSVFNSAFSANVAREFGGGVFSQSSGQALLQQDTFSGNSGEYGGAIGSFTGLFVAQSNFSGNHADIYGGALHVYTSPSYGASITDSVLERNSGGQGGAINVLGDGGFDIVSSLLKNNTAIAGGGGLFAGASVTVSQSSLEGNAADYGAGVYVNSNDFTLAGSLLAGNVAAHQGGGLYVHSASPARLVNATLSQNTAGQQGGGVFNNGDLTARNVTFSDNAATTGGGLVTDIAATSILTNTILAYSPTGGNCFGRALAAQKYNISSDGTCALSGTVHGHDPNNLAPNLMGLTGLGNYGGPTRVHMLQLSSLALDGILGSDAPPIDQRGQPRPSGLSYDIGAVERQPNDVSLIPWLWLPLVRR